MAFGDKSDTQAFKATAADITGAVMAASPKALSAAFSASAGETLLKEPDDVLAVKDVFNTAGFNDERVNLERSLVAGALTESQIGVALSGAAKHQAEQAEKRKRDKERTNDVAFLALMDRINDRIAELEAGLAAKYGEDFAEHLAYEYLDEEIAKRRAGETDQEYKQRIALEICDRSEKGLISVNDPKAQEWAEENGAKARVELQAVNKGTIQFSEVSLGAQRMYAAQEHTTVEEIEKIEEAAKETYQSEDKVEFAENTKINNDFSIDL